MDINSFLIGYTKGKASVPEGGGGSSASEKEVNFYDYDGTLLHSYTVAEAQALTELPEQPEHEGLIGEGWNWTLDDIKAHNRAVNVGAHYVTDDGKTRLYINIPTIEHAIVNLRLSVSGAGDTVVIDWGDGTGDTIEQASSPSGTANIVNLTHTYATIGDYIVTIENETFLTLGFPSQSVMTSSNAASSDCCLRKVEIGAKVNHLSDYSFYYCNSLETITIPKDVVLGGGGKSCFANCISLKSIVIPRGETEIPQAFCGLCTCLKSVQLPPTIETLGSSAFGACRSLNTITLPDGVVTIGDTCFGTGGLKKIVFPESVQTVGACISTNAKLEEVVFEGAPKSFDVSFIGCSSLTAVTIPEGVNELPKNAFNACSLLESVNLPESLQTIGTGAFTDCNKLKRINIPNGVSALGNSVFDDCHSLTEIEVPPSVTSIGTYAFQKCYALGVIDFSSHTAVPTLSSTNAFTSVPSKCKIKVPTALYDEWVAATNWASYVNRIVAV